MNDVIILIRLFFFLKMQFKYNIKPNILGDNFKVLIIDLQRVKNKNDIFKIFDIISKYENQYHLYLTNKQLLYANQYNFKLKNKPEEQKLNDFKENY